MRSDDEAAANAILVAECSLTLYSYVEAGACATSTRKGKRGRVTINDGWLAITGQLGKRWITCDIEDIRILVKRMDVVKCPSLPT